MALEQNQRRQRRLRVPLVYLEVQPLEPGFSLTAAFVKYQLLRLSQQFHSEESAVERYNTLGLVADKVLERDDDTNNFSSGEMFLFRSNDLVSEGKIRNERWDIENHARRVVVRSNDPNVNTLCPCQCRGYHVSMGKSMKEYDREVVYPIHVFLTDATLVRVLPYWSDNSWKEQLVGEVPMNEMILSKQDELMVWKTQNSDAISQLTLRMKRIFSCPLQVGTTADAFQCRNDCMSTHAAIQNCIRRHLKKDLTFTKEDHETVAQSDCFRDGSLLVHSPDHSAGKTTIVQAIAHRLGAKVIFFQPAAMFAKFGVYADVALACQIHAACVSAAFQRQDICVVLDGLDAFLPTQAHAAAGGDAASPALFGMASYLQTLTRSILMRKEIPFPRHNPLYNCNSNGGVVLSVNVCLVSILTCPHNKDEYNIGRSLSMGMYRLPSLASETRLSAFQWALSTEKVDLEPIYAQPRLPFLAAAAFWARGPVFRRMAQTIRAVSLQKDRQIQKNASGLPCSVVATLDTLQSAFAAGGKTSARGSDVQFLAADHGSTDLFATVGGNEEAKSALEDALTLDPDRRKLLLKFGLSFPSGILLYGPPGTGKTLLAKAVARLLRSGSSSLVGGAFIALNTTDIVVGEVGSGEKVVVKAFETARMNSPAVVFIDEFQALFTQRSSGVSGRLTTTLLQCMDDIKQSSEIHRLANSEQDGIEAGRVLVLAATNTPWMVDKAFLRPGRFDRSIHVGLPDFDARKSILSIYVRKMKTKFASDEGKQAVLCEKMAYATEGCSGADLAALCRGAAVQCLLRHGDSIEEMDFLNVLDDGFTPSISKALVDRIRKWHP
jgi:ATP-dependent 26S proteasome regulatory subunit